MATSFRCPSNYPCFHLAKRFYSKLTLRRHSMRFRQNMLLENVCRLRSVNGNWLVFRQWFRFKKSKKPNILDDVQKFIEHWLINVNVLTEVEPTVLETESPWDSKTLPVTSYLKNGWVELDVFNSFPWMKHKKYFLVKILIIFGQVVVVVVKTVDDAIILSLWFRYSSGSEEEVVQPRPPYPEQDPPYLLPADN